tara:strand:- start:76 stop:288 length:213 start_codon:yes stop_codon:yes gene_type:complete
MDLIVINQHESDAERIEQEVEHFGFTLRESIEYIKINYPHVSYYDYGSTSMDFIENEFDTDCYHLIQTRL